jgi:hypothetical protein
MIVEHTFITTRPAQDALNAAETLLASLHFAPSGDQSALAREWRRGGTTARRARGLSDLPQRIRLEFDRGRVSVAGSVELRRKQQRSPRDAMVAITVALERLLADNQPPDTAAADARASQARLERIDRNWRIAGWCILLIPVILIAATVAWHFGGR